MANNYLQFSEVIPLLNADEETWLLQQLEHIFVFGDREYADHDLPKDLNRHDADWTGFRIWRNTDNDEPDWLEFDYKIEDDTRCGWGRHLWVFAEESGQPRHIAHLVQKFLQRFRPDQCWSLTYAVTCPKPQVGEFWGGACFVTADEIRWQHGYTFIEEQRKTFADAKKEAST